MYTVRFNNNRHSGSSFWLGRDDSGNIQEEGHKDFAERYESVLAAAAAIKEYEDDAVGTDRVGDSWEIVKVR